MTREEARKALIDWTFQHRRLARDLGRMTILRDDHVRSALAAGVSKQEVHDLTGIARTTIDRIIREQS
jgi:hypothetical protein